jgi:hypothetical protein
MFFKPSDVEIEEGWTPLADRKNGDDLPLPLHPDDVRMLGARVGRAQAAGGPPDPKQVPAPAPASVIGRKL